MMSRAILAMALSVATASCTAAPQQRQADGEAEIRALLDRWADAFRRKDVDAVMAVYARGDEVVAYDLVPPLAYGGSEAYRRDYADFFAEFKGPMQVEFRDLRIVAGDDVAFAHGLERMAGTLTDGTSFETWLRVTQGYRRVNGRWLAVHDHVSVPAEPKTQKARFDLKP
jgi:uncharacterized protein (TIGR02246 family)